MAKKNKKIKAIDRVLEGVNENPKRKLSLAVTLRVLLKPWAVQALFAVLVGLMLFMISTRSKFNLDPILFMGEKIKLEGQVVKLTNSGHKFMGQTIMKVHYKIMVDGQPYENSSYLQGWGPKEDKLEVEYLKGQPQRSRAIDGRTTVHGLFFPLCFIVTLLALIMTLVKKLGHVSILKYGVRALINFNGLKEKKGPIFDSYIHKFRFKDLAGELVHGRFTSPESHRFARDKELYFLKSAPQKHRALGEYERQGVVFCESNEELDLAQTKVSYLALILPLVFVALLLLAS